ncbi:MAG: imidazoleglycerol-phosphate dehydratase HisB [Spirochaetia bacterium]|nr:imidazoleglycerol-phosphate dehydratase HisB [Spirochaetia bacterium]
MSLVSKPINYQRKTKETEIDFTLNLYGEGKAVFNTEIPFFEHMLDHVARQSLMDIDLKLKGDIGIDCHHSVEDTGIVFGNLLHQALGDKSGIGRYGHFTITMDEVLATVALDLGGRFSFVWNAPDKIREGKFGIYDAELSLEFLEKFAQNAKMNLHVLVHYGENRHHIHEAVFKALGRALRMAVEMDPRRSGVASTKGVLE